MSFGSSLGIAVFSTALAAGGVVKLAWPSGGQPVRPAGVIGDEGSVRPVRPAGVAVDDNDRVFVADPMQGAVLVYDRKRTSPTRWTGNAAFPLMGPVDVALDHAGRLFVADGFQHQVVVFDTAGAPTAAFGKDVLKRPSAVAVDARNARVWVADTLQNLVYSFDLATFKPGRSIGGAGSAGFVFPSSLAVDSRGFLYVSDRQYCCVQRFDAGGVPMTHVDVECDGKPEGSRPNLVAVDRADRLYVVRPEDTSLQVFSRTGSPLQYVPALARSTDGSPIRAGMAVGPDNRIYVVEQDEGTGRVRVYTGGPGAGPVGRRPGEALAKK